jgi:transposase
MARERRQYDGQFKQEAVRLSESKGVPDAARDLGVPVDRIYTWRRKFAADGNDAFPGHGKLKPQDEEMRQLKRELASVTEQRDILKKALAIFSIPRR